jgi:long-chain acyl-CoA synthetase
MLCNCRGWVAFDQAALGLGLVVVPLYVEDRPENSAYILRDAGVRVLLIDGRDQWARYAELLDYDYDAGVLSMEAPDEQQGA